MCTVTYIPKGNNNFILTSNRDETPKRKTIPPKEYSIDGVQLCFPKDEVAGGTWIGLSEKNRLICLLNGGFKIHEREASYQMSRGVIVKMLLTSDDAVTEIENFDFNGIEPFTIVLVDWNETPLTASQGTFIKNDVSSSSSPQGDSLKVYELVWTGTEKHFKQLEQKPHIWSSSTLYTDEMKELRQNWFADWLFDREDITSSEIIEFHQDETKGNSEISLKMKRAIVETVSTTCIEKSALGIDMSYTDYINNSHLGIEDVFSLNKELS